MELKAHAAQRLHLDLPHLVHLGEIRGGEDGTVVLVHRLTIPRLWPAEHGGILTIQKRTYFAPAKKDSEQTEASIFCPLIGPAACSRLRTGELEDAWSWIHRWCTSYGNI